MTAFAALTEATEREDTDEVAVARGTETLRMALSLLLGGISGVVDVTETGLPTASADGKGKIHINHEIPAGWIVHEVPQTESDPAGHFAEYATDQAIGYTAATRARAYARDLDLGLGSGRSGVADAATIWIVDGAVAEAYHAGTLARHHDLDIALGAGDWVGGGTNGTLVWFINNTTNMAQAYNATTGARASANDYNLGAGTWTGGVAAGSNIWFINDATNTALAYLAGFNARLANLDIALGAGDWVGAASDGTGSTIWFLDTAANSARAYTVSTRARNASHDVALTSGTWTGAFGDGTTLWFIADISSHHFVGEWPTDTAATANGWDTQGEWYYNTGDRTGYRLDRVSGSLRSRGHSMTTLLGSGHIWLGHADNFADLLLRIADFDNATVYVGEVGNRLVQLYNASYAAGNDGHTIYDWELVLGLGTPKGLITHEVGSRSTTLNVGTAWVATGIILPSETDSEWILFHVNKGEWHLNRSSDYADADTAAAGDDPGTDDVWDQFVEIASGSLRAFSLGITADNELLIAGPNGSTITSLEVRSVPYPVT